MLVSSGQICIEGDPTRRCWLCAYDIGQEHLPNQVRFTDSTAHGRPLPALQFKVVNRGPSYYPEEFRKLVRQRRVI